MTEGQHLDIEVLSELKELMDKEFAVLLETYLSDSVNKLQSIKAAVDQGSASELLESAHSFKGSSGNIGAIRLANLSKNIEDRAREDRLGGVEVLLADMWDEYQIVQQLLKDELRNPH